MRQILVVVHQETSDPGLVGQLLQELGYTLDLRCPAIGQALPHNLAPYSGVIVMGGPMSANDDQHLPFIRDELAWIPTVLSSETPYLGICLGAQMLARVLGSRVAPHPEGLREIGYFPLRPTSASRQVFTQPMHVYHWHQEGFELPEGCDLLAVGETFPNQAFRYGDRTYGLQFHPEITAALIDHWTTQAADQLTLPGAQPKSLHLDQHNLYHEAVENWLRSFLTQWLAKALGSSVGRLSA
ncbi:MAG TPA: glutamine amidotransferase [Trichocoleus sp.]